MLYIFGGLPAVGKSTLALRLANHLKAVYLRIDTIEQSIRDSGLQITGPEGYCIAYQLAEENLKIGNSVIADSVNPIELTRSAWRAVAARADKPFTEIEITCTDKTEHRKRAETRPPTVTGLKLPTWQDVMDREYEQWDTSITIDTAGQTVEESFTALLEALRKTKRRVGF